MKHAVTGSLLLFVAVTAAYLVFQEATSSPTAGDRAAPPPPIPAGDLGAADPETAADRPGEPAGSVLTAYYFHGTSRCPTCLNMERWAQEAIAETFPEEMEDGRIRWQAVNYDDAANEHFVNAYDLYASTLVLASDGSGAKGTWRKPGRIWELAGDEQAFKSYVIDEVADMLRTGP